MPSTAACKQGEFGRLFVGPVRHFLSNYVKNNEKTLRLVAVASIMHLPIGPKKVANVGGSRTMQTVSKRWASLTKCCALFLFVVVATISNKAAGAVVLSNATATFSQGSGFPATATIDGIFATQNGWAISQGGTAVFAETIVYEIAANPAAQAGAYFWFTLSQNHVTQHTLGRFRLSVTSDDPNTFADGLQTGGDVSANWTQLTPLTALATNGALLSIQGDNSILAGGPNPGTSVYTITAYTPLSGITGLRLEALEHPSLPFNGPGRQPINGNFVLTELEVSAYAVVPEPAMFMVFGLGIALAFSKRRALSNLLRSI